MSPELLELAEAVIGIIMVLLLAGIIIALVGVSGFLLKALLEFLDNLFR